MTKQAITFIETREQLLLVYRPRDGAHWVQERFSKGQTLSIRKTFELTAEHLVPKEPADEGDDVLLSDDSEWELSFAVASVDGGYFRFDPKVLPVGVEVLLARGAKPTWKWFSTEQSVSVLGVVAELKPSRIVIGGSEPDAIPLPAYQQLIEQVPTPREMKHYVQARVATVARQYTDATIDAEAKLNAYVNKRVKLKGANLMQAVRSNEIQKYSLLLRKLQDMLASEEGYPEHTWQNEILQIVCLLNPRYIKAFKSVPVWDSDSDSRRILDILLVDASGNVDVIEIKRPFAKCIVSEARYRDNHIPLRELSGTVIQIEKYLRHLNRGGVEGEKKLRAHFGNRLPPHFQIKVTNPSGMLIMGRDDGMTAEQLRDFEITRRHYKHVVDIVTYDDLLRRLDAVLKQFEAGGDVVVDDKL
jgi:hypothetical protein